MKLMYTCSAYEIVMIVHELHQRGYEQLRLFPGMSPNGCSWRWAVYPKVLMKDNNLFERHSDCMPFDCPYGSTGVALPEEGEVMKTANDFMREYESYVNLAKGNDKEYVEWYKAIVEHAKNEDFPIAFEEFFDAKQWKFMKGEALQYPPFLPAPIDQLTDTQMIDMAKCVFDEESVRELNEFICCDGPKSTTQEVAEVIRKALREQKSLFCHYDSYERFTELIAWGDEEKEESRVSE
jgi:hypothetical protein